MIDFSKFHEVEEGEMQTCVLPTIYKVFDSKPIGTDYVKTGMFQGCCLSIKVEGNVVTFAMPFNAPVVMLKDYLTKEDRNGTICSRHYNKSDSIIYDIEQSDDNTLLIMRFYTKELKMFL